MLLPGDFTVPSNHLLGLQTSASSPQILLFLETVKGAAKIVDYMR
jgi:hypothetical protein